MQPDTIEIWNIQHYFQPPLPSAPSNAAAIQFWECWLDRGAHIGATGGSDSHWLSTSLFQGPGNPTTWVHTASRSTAGILAALRLGRTSVGLVPPALGGGPLLLEADADGDGIYEALTGDTVPPGSSMRVRSAGTGAAWWTSAGTAPTSSSARCWRPVARCASEPRPTARRDGCEQPSPSRCPR